MAYCVNCDVELSPGAAVCPLCGTPAWHPPGEESGEPYFPTKSPAVGPASRRAAAILLSSMLASAVVCCGLLNLLFMNRYPWSLYIIGAAVMLWIWFVLPLVARLPLFLRLTLDVAAVGVYVYLISVSLGGADWFRRLALPILCLLCVLVFLLSYLLREGRHSRLFSLSAAFGAAALMTVGVEYFTDVYLRGAWTPGWSLITAAICVSLIIPLQIIRHVPALREEVRRRFNL